jgi:putative MATE family efflux protein
MKFKEGDHLQQTVQSDFSQGKVWKNIMRLAIPMTLAQLIQVLYNVVDRMYIGHLPDASSLALTGVGLTFPIITMINAFTNLFGMGGAPLFSISRGQQKEERASEIQKTSFVMLCLTGAVLMILAYLFRRPIMYAFGASDLTYPYADAYLQTYLLGTIPVMIAIGMNSFINAQGFGRVGMLTVTLGAVINILLDPVFIFLLDLGVRGAGLATALSQLVSAVWVLHFLTGHRVLIPLHLKGFRLRLSLVKEITALGFSGFIMAVTNGLCQIVCNKMLFIFGGDLYVGVMTVLNSVREILSLAVTGITNSAQPVLGYNYGAGQYRRVRSGIMFISIACAAYTTFVWLIIMWQPDPFIRLFSSDPALLEAGRSALHAYFFGFFFMSFQFAGQSTFTALGRSKQAVFFSLFRKVIIVVPLTILLPYVGSLGVHGVFWAEPISNAVGGLACFITMMLTVWRELVRLEQPSK